jgi:deoxycytidylate deaminase
MKESDQRIFDVARNLSYISTHPKAHIGAVLVSGRDVIAVGVNGRKTHPLQKFYNRYRFHDDKDSMHLMHAELEALIKGNQYLVNTENVKTIMYVYREYRHTRKLAMARPCTGCIRALRDFNVHRAYYTTPDGFAYEEFK